MPGFEDMDDWSSEDVALFKERGEEQEALPLEAAVAPEAVAVGTLVAEGDSWFDFLPGTDLIDCLRNHHGYRIKNAAKAGDTLENMIYGTGINRSFERTHPSIRSVLRRLESINPKIFLFSGGGNDVAGDEFESYLNHKASSLPTLRSDYVDHIIFTVFRKYLKDLIAMVAQASAATHVVMHGYGRPLPTGKGVGWSILTFAGPWLRPALARKGIFDEDEQQHSVFTLINRFNEMLAQLDAEEPKFHHVDLRDEINPAEDWSDELHLRNSAFARCAERIHETMVSLA